MNRTRVLWITVDQCSTTELQKPLPTTWARGQCIYINEMVMPVKEKGYININILHLHSLTIDGSQSCV